MDRAQAEGLLGTVGVDDDDVSDVLNDDRGIAAGGVQHYRGDGVHNGKCDCTECASFKLGDHGTDCGCK